MHPQILSNAEFTYQQHLRNNPLFVIRPADKDSDVVIMEKIIIYQNVTDS